ncbi:hypothetical protein IQ13_4158 [Lacibacter cauensis]|uniref:Uncharacterized protein n=1 Tax=Lacibacter cauensis TaxID=510947 RepID=A0A562S9A9_9BACT|nr:hypothetical protein IQ13_4158 [Lacibacter cauensis]
MQHLTTTFSYKRLLSVKANIHSSILTDTKQSLLSALIGRIGSSCINICYENKCFPSAQKLT